MNGRFMSFIYIGLTRWEIENVVLPILFSVVCLFLASYLSKRDKLKKIEDNQKNLNESRNHILYLKNLIETNQKIKWEDLFSVKFNTEVYTDVIECIKEGIEKGLFCGDFFGSQNSYHFMKIIKDQTLIYFDNLASKSNLENYSFVEISRSTHKEIDIGTYIYRFDDNDNLHLMRAPFRVKNYDSVAYPILDSDLISRVVYLDESVIKDFQVFGTQLMQTDITNSSLKPGISTIFSELLFGSSYTILKGLNNFSLSTSHSVKDIRVVQVILTDKSDIELNGISIYYEFNRRFGKAQNKEENLLEKDERPGFQSQSNSNLTILDLISKMSDLKDKGVITEDEFLNKKKELLDKI